MNRVLKIGNVLNAQEVTTIPWQLGVKIDENEGVQVTHLVINRQSQAIRKIRSIKNQLLSFDVIHSHHTYSAAFVSLIRCFSIFSKRQPVYIHTVHRNFLAFSWGQKLIYTMFVFPFRDAVICNSQTTLQSIPGYLRWLWSGKFSATYNGVEMPGPTKIKRIKDSKAEYHLINVARMVPIKDQKTILKALKILRDKGHNVSLEFCGDGLVRHALEDLTEELGLIDAVTFCGMLPRKEVHRKMRDADIAVTASLSEGFGVATIEAAVENTLVLATDIDIHRELLEDDDLLFEASNPVALANCVAKYITSSAVFYEKVVTTRDRVNRFDIKKTAADHIKLYTTLAS